MMVVDDDGSHYQTLEDQATALSRHWGTQFSESDRIDQRAAAEQLQHVGTLQADALRMLDYDAFARLCERLPHSAPGTDGLPYACLTAAGERARRTLFEVYGAIAAGMLVPSEFNESYMVFIPTGEMAYQAPPSRFRPLNLSNIAQNLVSKALNSTLEEAASILVSPIQRGFVRHRSLIDSILDVEFVMESAIVVGATRAGTVLFDIAAAFPSVEWEWLMLAIERQGLPVWVRNLVRGMLENSTAAILFGGALTVVSIDIRRGIRQGFRSSGSLWAILFDPLVRARSLAIPRDLGLAGCFAEDLACAFRDVVEGLRRALLVLRSLRRVAGLALNLAQSVLVNYSQMADFEIDRLLQPVLGGDALRIADCGEYLGILIGPGAPARHWDAPVEKYSSRCHHVRSLALSIHDRRVAYQLFAFSVLLLRGRLRAPDRGLLASEAAACAALMGAPLQAFTVNCLTSLRVLGAGFSFPGASSTMHAASTRVALTHPLLAQHLLALGRLAESDDALLYPDRPLWVRAGTLATLGQRSDAPTIYRRLCAIMAIPRAASCALQLIRQPRDACESF